ncbi:unnamed protein product [Didymodactylos carnosus]|uniref:Uncharacterized protein n=1 Tax=Didymodactylos carnosus TaxID=1234261 RepID=A0A815H7S2_9BILA|nr:unnamed protein product [Didymodactylos carnosus]CAF4215886.1 unnamed protein product [Didymodactylos carnosus]
MSMKGKRDISSFGFISSKKQKTPVENAKETWDISTVENRNGDSFFSMRDSSTSVTIADKSIFTNLKNDIGSLIKSRLSLDDDIRYLLLKDHFMPSGNSKWPYSERNTHMTVEKRYLNQKHLKDNS